MDFDVNSVIFFRIALKIVVKANLFLKFFVYLCTLYKFQFRFAYLLRNLFSFIDGFLKIMSAIDHLRVNIYNNF